MYTAMTNPEERAVLLGRPREEAQSNVIVRTLGQLLISRFRGGLHVQGHHGAAAHGLELAALLLGHRAPDQD